MLSAHATIYLVIVSLSDVSPWPCP